MARNGSGTFTKAVSSFSPGGTIAASDHNSLWDDAASEITNSVAVDGQSTMTGVLKHASGSKAAPSLTFGSDPDSGLYLSSANEVSIVASASQVAIFSASAMQFKTPALFTTTLGVTGELTVSATANFSLGFISSATAVFMAGIAVSSTAVFSHPVLMSGTATFTKGFLASNTCSFSHPILVSGTATFTKGFIASATASFSGANPVIAKNTAKAWAIVTQSGGTYTLRNGFNVASITKNGTGDVTVTFTNAFADTYYALVGGAEDATLGYTVTSGGNATGSARIILRAQSTGNPGDPGSFSIACFGV